MEFDIGIEPYLSKQKPPAYVLATMGPELQNNRQTKGKQPIHMNVPCNMHRWVKKWGSFH